MSTSTIETSVRSATQDSTPTVGVSMWVRDTATNDVADIVEQARRAQQLGIRRVWFGQRFDADALTLAAVVGSSVPDLEVGTSVVPINPRHPLVVASQAQTAQAATGGRLTLGLGLGAPELEGMAFGIHQDRQIRRLREYLTVLHAAIEDGGVQLHGETLTANPPMPTRVRGGSHIPILVGAMGPQALEVTGTLADGTLPLLAGPRVLEQHIVPAITDAAAHAGRQPPRVVAAVVAVVTDNRDATQARATEELAFYESLASYRGQLDKEGVDRAGELAVIGTETEVQRGLQRYFDAGATEVLVSQTYLGGPEAQDRTWRFLGDTYR